MLDQVKILTAADATTAGDFYQAVCAHQAQDDYGPEWTWGDYPNQADILAACQQGQLLGGYQEGRLAAAGKLTRGDDPTYHSVPWPTEATDNQVAVLHLYAVSGPGRFISDAPSHFKDGQAAGRDRGSFRCGQRQRPRR